VNGVEPVANCLELLSVLAREEAIVESFEADSTPLELFLDPLVAVKAHAYPKGDVRRKLDEARSPVGVEDVEVVVVDRDVGAIEIETGCRPVAAPALTRAKGSIVFLSYADEDHSLGSPEPSKAFLGDVVLTFATFEGDDRNTVAFRESADGVHEAFCHLSQQSRRWHGVSAMHVEEIGELVGALKAGDVTLEVDAVDAFDLQCNVLSKYGLNVRHFDVLQVPMTTDTGAPAF
jgi:hypothetical protein